MYSFSQRNDPDGRGGRKEERPYSRRGEEIVSLRKRKMITISLSKRGKSSRKRRGEKRGKGFRLSLKKKNGTVAFPKEVGEKGQLRSRRKEERRGGRPHCTFVFIDEKKRKKGDDRCHCGAPQEKKGRKARGLKRSEKKGGIGKSRSDYFFKRRGKKKERGASFSVDGQR